jgi:very-short-patch-repair endonuclease
MRRRLFVGERPFAQRGATERKMQFARELRASPTQAEGVLWRALRGRRLDGLRFRRQHPIAGYIVDFYCPALRLAIEVDGEIHDAREQEDQERDRALARLGCVLLRLHNDEVLGQLDAIVDRIATLCARVVDSSTRKSGGGREGGVTGASAAAAADRDLAE